MKIGVVQSTAPNYGATFVLNQVVELKKLGHDLRMFGFRDKNVSPELKCWFSSEVSVPVYHPFYTPRWKVIRNLFFRASVLIQPKKTRQQLLALAARGADAPWVDPAILYFWGILFKQHPDLDVVIAHFAPIGGVIAILKEANIIRCPLVTALHGADITSRESDVNHRSGLYRAAIAGTSAFTFNSTFIRDRAVEAGFPAERMHRIPMAVGQSFLEPIPARKNQAAPFRIISVGRFVEKKGHLTGLMAFREVLNHLPDSEYMLIGDGPLRGKMQEFIAQEKLENKVVMPGVLTQKQVREEFLQSDVFLFPSETASNGDMEGQGLVVQEAQACGLPVVVTRHNGVPDGMVDGETGFVVEERDHSAMALKLLELARNCGLRQNMGEAARDFVLHNFSGPKIAKNLEQLLLLVASKRK